MAGDRTEAPTPQRRDELRKQGRVPRSSELQTAAVLLGALLCLQNAGGGVFTGLGQAMAHVLQAVPLGVREPDALTDPALTLTLAMTVAVAPLILTAWLAGGLTAVGQSGINFSTHPLLPDFDRLNPLRALQRWFSTDGMVQLAKDILKLSLIGITGWRVIEARKDDMLLLPQQPLALGAANAFHIAMDMAMQTTLVFVALAAADFMYQRWHFEQSIKMSKEEVRESNRQAEGDPKVKARLRAMARKFARGRMLQAVPRASVIVTNPTHLAVALEYRPDAMAAPRVIAKGERLLALRIREIAAEHGIPTVENVPLAWAIHRATEIGDYVPPDLYTAVAEVLAFVMNLAARRAGVGA